MPAAAPQQTDQAQTPSQNVSTDIAAWATDLRSAIMAQAAKLTGLPYGSQRMHFRVGSDGEITMATAVGPVANPELAEKLAAFLNTIRGLPKPPDGKVRFTDVNFRF